jgi:hypothetical protein
MYPRRNEGEVIQPIGRALRLLEDEDNNPVKAEIITYVDPDFAGQVTGCQVLNVRSGESVEHDPIEAQLRRTGSSAEAAPKRPTEHHVAPVVGEVAAGVVVEEVDLLHAERPTSRDEGDDSILTMAEAAARSGLGMRAFVNLWKARGLNPGDLVFASELRESLERIWAENEHLRPQPLPETGFVHESVVMPQVRAARALKAAGLRQVAALRGYTARRFISANGLVGFYYAEEDVAPMLAAIRKR